MKNKKSSVVESSYRTFYGKLFSALFSKFGANYVSEIEDAIQNSFYKSLQVSENEIAIVEEILYAVFNIGFDSFSEKIKSIINEDLCLEALALAKVLSDQFEQTTTKNLLALFCFHLARIPSKVKNDKIISFFEQDKKNWNNDFIKLAFHYLEKPEKLNK